MALKLDRFAAGLAVAASVSMAAPASAASLPYAPSAVLGASVNTGIESAGYGPYRYPYRHYRRGPSTGDVLAGVLILGGIAAVATAASRSSRNRSAPLPPPYPDRSDYRQSSGIDRAVDMCVDEVERGRVRVDSVERANRDAYGWQVSGRLDNGAGWTCEIGNDGRIRGVNADTYGGSYNAGYRDTDRGYGDDPYGADYRDTGSYGGDYRDAGSYGGDYRDDPYRSDDYDDRPVWTGSDGGSGPPVTDRQYDDETYARVRAATGGGYATPGY
ncbi:hypothetical protein [Altericroceibacterium xinjiangense]|uniref:hypothetical protein n=1 Tax=Altericroceibacterium xinjiangense TaxID=762261 RepID=UPI000F7DD7D5|nr:hypothetical protein [Altericroceibacterium xinjiangense]